MPNHGVVLVTVEDQSGAEAIASVLVYLFEFKVVEASPEGRALQQLKDRDYAAKYRASGQAIHLIGVEFSRERRSVVGFQVETPTPG